MYTGGGLAFVSGCGWWLAGVVGWLLCMVLGCWVDEVVVVALVLAGMVSICFLCTLLIWFLCNFAMRVPQ